MSVHPDYPDYPYSTVPRIRPVPQPQRARRDPSPEAMPPSVLVAILTMAVLALLTLVSIPVSYSQRDLAIQLGVQAGGNPADMTAVVDQMLAMQAALSVGGALLAASMAVLLRRRRQWARVVGSVTLAVFGMSAVYTVLIGATMTIGQTLVNVGNGVFALASGIALWLPASTLWYRPDH